MFIGNCRICSSSSLGVFLNLGQQPWCNDFVEKENVGKEATYPLEVCFCHQCSAVQINYNVPKETMYLNHTYLSGITSTMSKHFQNVSLTASRFVRQGLVVDIGSNDGTLLSAFRKISMDILGVEPCTAAASVAINNGIPTKIQFFNHSCAEEILDEHGPASIISAANVFYHVEDLHDIVKGIKCLLDKNGIFIMHGSYLPNLIRDNAFDIMYHEHLLYYRMYTLNYLLNLYDMEVFDVEEHSVHGGSIVAYVSHVGKRKVGTNVHQMLQRESDADLDKIDVYYSFAERVGNLKHRIKKMIEDILSKGQTIYAYGAPAKGTVLLNYCQLTREHIELASEKNPLKFGKYIPSTGIPITDEALTDEPDYYLMLPWNFAPEFCRSPEFLSGKRKFIIPIPEPKVLS